MADETTTDADRNGDKLVPEWRLDADSQVVVAGLVVVVALVIAMAWSVWQGIGQDPANPIPVAPSDSLLAPESLDPSDLTGP